MKKIKNIPRAQTTPDMLFGPIFVIATQSNPPQAFKTPKKSLASSKKTGRKKNVPTTVFVVAGQVELC